MRKCSLVLLLMGVIAISQAGVIGNFEAGLDNWTASWEGTATLANSTTAGTVTLDAQSLAVKISDTGYWELQWNAPVIPASMTNAKLTFDLTMIASEWTGSNWTKVADKVALNSNGASGWMEFASTAAIDRTTLLSTSTDWGPWSGDAAKTYSLDIPSYDTTSATWFQIVISLQQNPVDGAGNFYFDNIQFIPEPTTMTMLGLGALALLRKKK